MNFCKQVESSQKHGHSSKKPRRHHLIHQRKSEDWCVTQLLCDMLWFNPVEGVLGFTAIDTGGRVENNCVIPFSENIDGWSNLCCVHL